MKKLNKAILVALSAASMATLSTNALALSDYKGDLVFNGSNASLSGSLLPQGWNGTNNGGFGWGHNSEWFRLNVTAAGNIDIRVTGTTTGVQPAFSVWSTGSVGFDTSIGGAHAYNQVSDTPWDDGGGSSGTLDFVGLANNNLGGCGALSSCGDSYGVGPGPGAAPGAVASKGVINGFNYADLILPNVTAGSWYLIAVGGSGGSSGGYNISVSPAAVPVPGALWLFGSAMAGLIGFRKRAA